MVIYQENARFFQFWAYTVSHSTLLLRSKKDDDLDILSRIDIVIIGINQINLPSNFHLDKITSEKIDNIYIKYQFYLEDNLLGEILAVQAEIMEDNKEFFEPSSLKIEWGILLACLTE